MSRQSLGSLGSSTDELRSFSRRSSMAFHLPEIADFFTEKDLSQIVDRAKNDALKNKQKVLWVKNNYSKFFSFSFSSYVCQLLHLSSFDYDCWKKFDIWLSSGASLFFALINSTWDFVLTTVEWNSLKNEPSEVEKLAMVGGADSLLKRSCYFYTAHKFGDNSRYDSIAVSPGIVK